MNCSWKVWLLLRVRHSELLNWDDVSDVKSPRRTGKVTGLSGVGLSDERRSRLAEET